MHICTALERKFGTDTELLNEVLRKCLSTIDKSKTGAYSVFNFEIILPYIALHFTLDKKHRLPPGC